MQSDLRSGPATPSPSEAAAESGEGQARTLSSFVRSGSLLSVLCVLGVTAFVIAQLRPDLLFGPNMDVGGDNAAHVVAVSYFIHHVLPHGELSGWDPEWFGGFPLYVFYFPLPALIAAALNLVFSYAVAFKLVSVLGLVLMPVAAWSFGALAGFRRPTPALMAVATVPFLFNTSYTIDGGNIASTLAGEFSFTLSMAFALFFLGVFIRSLRTGRLKWLAAALFCATLLCHVVPALFAAAAAVLFFLALPDRVRGEGGRVRSLLVAYRRPLLVLALIGVVGGLLSAIWLLPFGAYLRYSSSMGYERVPGFQVNFLPNSGEVVVQALGALGALIALVRRNRIAIVLAVLAALSVAGFFLLPSGLVYNARWLPFWFLTTALLAAYAVSSLGEALFVRLASRSWHPIVTPAAATVVTLVVMGAFLGALPFANVALGSRNFDPYWVEWNYSGYQAKPGWGQFEQLVAMLERVARTHGCGRLDYEYSPNTTDDFGSTLVPMSFPLWTNGCIESEEGVYYESSTSTPFHFLDQSELSLDASNPVVGLPYEGLDVADGIRHLRLTGVKYFLASSPSVEEQAASDPYLTEVGSSTESAQVVDRPAGTATPPASSTYNFILYEIKDAPVVEALSRQPVVASGLSKTSWLQMAISWYQDEKDWPVEIVTSGPKSWRRDENGDLVDPSGARRVDTTTISHVHLGADTVSFDSSRLGVPVLVKVPYFPNWQASGASGPYDATPNLMVVVPSAHHVTLSYGTTTLDWVGTAGSLVGLLGLLALWRANAPTPEPAVVLDAPIIAREDSGPGPSGDDSALPGWARLLDPTGGAGPVGPGPSTWERFAGEELGEDPDEAGGVETGTPTGDDGDATRDSDGRG